ncbi:hypothetical protein [Paenibacillus sp. PDC88]|uniref:hypothetical protein n=1 Tax=Paenibacillus sp. PDC88 TaxID=1884375 RepID=UPI000897AA04|nr:hypothetical protein [Paenibacillus sp. PDC88]SDW31405.1 hypothetical protein SAMN05518848_101976 [Paenibacillus sp. PDC88]
MPIKTAIHYQAVCAFYLALAGQMRRTGHIKIALHADKQYRTYRNLLQKEIQLLGSYPETAAL